VVCRPPSEGAHHLGDITLAALAALDLEGGDAGALQRHDHAAGIQADWILEQVAGLVPGREPAFAQRWVTRRFPGAEAVDGEAGQPRRGPFGVLHVADRLGG
jgi:hypothetical protein